MNLTYKQCLRRIRLMRSNFLTTCTNSYTRKKVASRSQLYADPKGRSMVEMLGVLAIVGVLSVGAIAGYSKAMMKYRLNKQAEQISWLLNVMYRYRSSLTNAPFTSLIPYFVKLGEIPENMITNNKTLHDVFNSEITIRTNNCYDSCDETVLFYSIAESKSFELCQNLLNVAKEFKNELRYTGVLQIEDSTPSYGNSYVGSRYCTAGRKCIKDMTQEQIYEQCSFCTKDSSLCSIYFIFYMKD